MTTNDRGRWSDLVDLACVHLGRPYLPHDEVTHLLWERTPYPLGTHAEVWAAVMEALTEERDLRTCPGCGWRTLFERCPHCGSTVPRCATCLGSRWLPMGTARCPDCAP